jgi:hypothetical protein
LLASSRAGVAWPLVPACSFSGSFYANDAQPNNRNRFPLGADASALL